MSRYFNNTASNGLIDIKASLKMASDSRKITSETTLIRWIGLKPLSSEKFKGMLSV